MLPRHLIVLIGRKLQKNLASMGKPVIVAASRKVDLPKLGNSPPTILETGIQIIFTYDPANRLLTSLAGTAVTTYFYDVNCNLKGV